MNQFLIGLEFHKAGALILRSSDSKPTFNFESEFLNGKAATSVGWVYLWVAFKGKDLTNIFYVGKAGKTLKARCHQHVGGFRGGSNKGIKNAEKIYAFLSEDETNRLELHARKSSAMTIFDEMNISLCEAEEAALIQKLRNMGQPLWNKI